MIDYVMFICYLSMLIRSCGSISLGCRKIGRFSVTLLIYIPTCERYISSTLDDLPQPLANL